MKFFDAGDQATGFIAVGQQATGFFALGQMATGVIAVGQMARGCFAVGQLAVGLVGWGQVGGGIFHAAGMVGIGGRKGLGLVLPIIPSIGRPRVMPEAIDPAAVHGGAEGWIEADLAVDPSVGLGLYLAGRRLPAKLDRRLQTRSREITADGPRRVRAYLRHIAGVLVCERIAHEPPRPYEKPSFRAIAGLQTAALLVCGIAWAGIVGHDVLTFLGEMVGVSAEIPVKKQPPSAPSKPGKRR